MQEQDKIIIKTEFTKNIISKLLNNIASKKAGCDAEIWINDLAITNDGTTTSIHVDMSADGNTLNLKRTFKGLLKWCTKVFSGNHLNYIINKIIKKETKKNINVEINNLNISKEFYIYLNADGKIRNEDFEIILKDAGLV